MTHLVNHPVDGGRSAIHGYIVNTMLLAYLNTE